MNKKDLTEADIRTKFITPALAGVNGDKWNVMTQLREEVFHPVSKRAGSGDASGRSAVGLPIPQAARAGTRDIVQKSRRDRVH